MTRPDEICAACGSATGHAGYGDDSIGYCGGTIGPLCDECNQRLRLEVEADGDLQAEIERLLIRAELRRIRGANPMLFAAITSDLYNKEMARWRAETDQLCWPGKGVEG
jgi:hypothetical protein